MKDAAWHKKQAAKIRTQNQSIARGQESLAVYWWEVGHRVNKIYGFLPGQQGPSAAAVPLADKEEFAEIYGVTFPVINNARKFHKLAQQPGERDTAILNYGTWTNIQHGFLTGQTVEEFEDERARDRRKREREREAARPTGGGRPIVGAPINENTIMHMENVPDDLLAAVEKELMFTDARMAIREAIRKLSASQIIRDYKRAHPERFTVPDNASSLLEGNAAVIAQ